MKRTVGAILMIVMALLLLGGLSAARYISLDRPPESETEPNRSTYNAGPTGVRAFYQLLEATGQPVGRWRENFAKLEQNGTASALVMIGPFNSATFRNKEELLALERWINNGGQLLLITRQLPFQLRGPLLRFNQKEPASQAPEGTRAAADRAPLVRQPTRLTRGIKEIALSPLATRLTIDEELLAGPPGPTSETAEQVIANDQPEEPLEDLIGPLSSPIVHLGDRDGAILIDFNFGGGRVLILTDPFIVANNGITQGANLDLALNLVRELDGEVASRRRLILFDEYHHGFGNDSNQLLAWFRGTPWPLIALQGGLICLLLWYSQSRRFSRPLPLPETDRHAPLEFVDSMASLQQTAEARDLAIENIYPRFRTRLCRRLGLSSRATNEQIIERLHLFKLPLAVDQLRQTLLEAELVLQGQSLTDQQLITIVDRLHAIETTLRESRRSGRR
jgi:hypothetical protein